MVGSKCRIVADCCPEDAQGGETATADADVSPKAAKQDLSDASEDCAMPDDYTKPPLPRMQAKQSHLSPEKSYLPTLVPVTKIGSSFEELRNYKIPKVKQRLPPTEENSSRIFQSPDVSQRSKQKCENPEHQEELTQSHSSSSSVGKLPSSGLLDKIIEDMNKAYPKVQGCYVECGNHCPTQNKAGKFPKSPTIHPPEDAKGIGWKGSRSAVLDRTPFSSHINQKQRSKICIMCKRRSVSEAGGTDTCIRCSLCKQITKEQAAVKEQATKEKLTVPVRGASAKINVRRGSSDVENKEQVTRIPTSPPSSRICSTKDKVNTTPVKENKKKTIYKKRHKVPLSRPVISSSDDSSNSTDDAGVEAASPLSTQQDCTTLTHTLQPRPQHTFATLVESRQNVVEEPPLKDRRQSSKKPLKASSTGSKVCKAKHRLQQSTGKSTKEGRRRKIMKKAWKNARDSNDYLRALSEMENNQDAAGAGSKKSENCEEHEKLESVRDDQTRIEHALESEQNGETVSDALTLSLGSPILADGPAVVKNEKSEEHEKLGSVKVDHIHTDTPSFEQHGEVASGTLRQSSVTLAPADSPVLIKIEESEKHEQKLDESVKGEQGDMKPASLKQSAEVVNDICGSALGLLTSADCPTLVVESCCSLSLMDWEGMKNESLDGVNPQVVGGETDKVAPACASSSDSGGSKREGGTVAKILQNFAAQGISPSATVIDPSHDGLKGKNFDAAKKCVMGLQYQVSFEDDGAMSVTIGDNESGGDGHEKGFSTGKFSGPVHQPQEFAASSAGNANHVGDLTARSQESGFTLNPEGVQKVGLPKQPGMFRASVPQGSLCDNSSHISTAATPRSKQGSVEQADTACSVDKGSRPVSLIEPAAPPPQPSLCAIADVNEPCVRTTDTTQGAVGGSNAAPLEGLALPIDQMVLSKTANMRRLGTDGSGTGSPPSLSNFTLAESQAAGVKNSYTGNDNVGKSCLSNSEVPASTTGHSFLPAREAMEMSCRKHSSRAKDVVRSSNFHCGNHSASAVEQSKLYITRSPFMHPARTDGCSGKNASTQSCEGPSEVMPVLPSSQNADSSNFPAYFDVVSLIDTVFGTRRAAVSTTGSGYGDEAGTVHLLLEEYVHYIEQFVGALHKCTAGFRDGLVNTLLPGKLKKLLRIVQLVWRMEDELQCLGEGRVLDLDKGIFSVLTEYAESISKSSAVQELPTFMSFEVSEPEMQTDAPRQEAAGNEEPTNSGEEPQHCTEVNATVDGASEIVGQLHTPQASAVSGTSVNLSPSKSVDAAACVAAGDLDHVEQTSAVPPSHQRATAGEHMNSLQTQRPSLHRRSTSLSGPPLSDPVTGKGKMVGQPMALQETVDLTDESTACPAAAVSPTVRPQREQLSTGVSCPQRAAQGMGQSSVPYEVLVTDLGAVSSVKVSGGANAKQATRVQTETAIANSASFISNSTRQREMAALPKQQWCDQESRSSYSTNRNSALTTGVEVDSMHNEQLPLDMSMPQGRKDWPRQSVNDACSTAQHSSQVPNRKRPHVNSQKNVAQGIPLNENCRPAQEAHPAAGRPNNERQVRFELRDPPPVVQIGQSPQPVQNERLYTQPSSMNSMQREELQRQLVAYSRYSAWVSAHGLTGNLQGSAALPYTSATQSRVPSDHTRTGQPLSHLSRPVPPVHSYMPEQGTVDARTQQKERQLCLKQKQQQQHQQQLVQRQQYMTGARTSNSSLAHSATRVTRMPSLMRPLDTRMPPLMRPPEDGNQAIDAALIRAESDVLSQMQQRDYLQLLVRQLRARQAATNTLASRQQPGSTAAAASRHVSEEEWSLQQQIRDALGRFQGACQSGQMQNRRAYESSQQPRQHLTREHSFKSSSKPRTSVSYTNARMSEESTAVRSSAQIVPPWNDKSRWPYPYTACQTALQIWKAQQVESEPGTGVSHGEAGLSAGPAAGRAAGRVADEQRAVSFLQSQQHAAVQDQVQIDTVSLPEQNSNFMAWSDISGQQPVRQVGSVAQQNLKAVARPDGFGNVPVQQVSMSTQNHSHAALPRMPSQVLAHQASVPVQNRNYVGCCDASGQVPVRQHDSVPEPALNYVALSGASVQAPMHEDCTPHQM